MRPAPDFARSALIIERVAPGVTFSRVHRDAFPEPLGYGKNRTRFSDPRRRIEANRFGVLYLGSSLKVCVVETIIRDERDGVVGPLYLEESELDSRLLSRIRIRDELRLVDLRGDGPIKMGIPSDVARGKRQGLARDWSLAFWSHPDDVDGIVYPSRLNGETNIAVYDRAIPKLAAGKTSGLTAATGLDDLLAEFEIALI